MLAIDDSASIFWAREIRGTISIAITFFVVCVAWVFFRAATPGDAVSYLAAMFGRGVDHAAAGLVAGSPSNVSSSSRFSNE